MKLLRLTLALALLSWSLVALADEDTTCMTDQDCPEDQMCVHVPCAAMPDCPEGEECPEPPPCPEEGYCTEAGGGDHGGVPGIWGGECATDADCPVFFACEEMVLPCPDMPTMGCECLCPEDDPDCECDGCPPPPPEPEPCEEETVQACVLELPECEAEGDCPKGFVCETIEECWGGGSTGCACPQETCACDCDPDDPDCECECPEPTPCECDEEPTYEEHCEVVDQICVPDEVACETDADCATDFECVEIEDDQGNATSCGCGCAAPPPPDCADDDAECWAEYEEELANYECPPCECEDEPVEPSEPEKVCAPVGWMEIFEDWVENGGGYGGESGSSDQALGPWTPNPGEEGGSGHGEEGPTTGAPSDTNGDDKGAGGDGESGTTRGASGDEGGTCAYGGGAPAGSGLLALLALMATWFIATRRERASVRTR